MSNRENSSPEISFNEDTVSDTAFEEISEDCRRVGINKDESVTWKGCSLRDITENKDPYEWEHMPPIRRSSDEHIVLFMLPVPSKGAPKPYSHSPVDKWTQGFVRMPSSSQNLYCAKKGDPPRQRWELIQEVLLQTFMSSHQLEKAILSYNRTYADKWDFCSLHQFFDEYIDDEESKLCFSILIPKMVQLALRLPDLITSPIPLLRKHMNRKLSLSQIQIASLLANAFFCTFPRRNSIDPRSEYSDYPSINFQELFGSSSYSSVMEKLKCIFHYFRRVTTKEPEGTVTIERKYIPKSTCPKWERRFEHLTKMHITDVGKIESEGAGMLQVDFANKFIGGGVLNHGCVQEEIRFVICPELLVTMLVTEVLDDTEAVVVYGAERYSQYEGYSNSFKWTGDYIDETPRDSSGRRKTCIVAIDALYFKQPNVQYSEKNILRELNKAYVGFHTYMNSNIPPIATGNWGCGAFRGNSELKALIQLMAASVSNRSLVYFTFGDKKLRDRLSDMYFHLKGHDFTIGSLYTLICKFQECFDENNNDFYKFLYDQSKTKSITYYFTANKSTKDKNATSQNEPEKSHISKDFKKYISNAKLQEEEAEKKIEEWLERVEDDDDDDLKQKSSNNSEISNKKIDCVIEMDEDVIQFTNQNSSVDMKTSADSNKKRISRLDMFDRLVREENVKISGQATSMMEVDEIIESDVEMSTIRSTPKSSVAIRKSIPNQNSKTQTKISDYFKKKGD